MQTVLECNVGYVNIYLCEELTLPVSKLTEDSPTRTKHEKRTLNAEGEEEMRG